MIVEAIIKALIKYRCITIGWYDERISKAQWDNLSLR